MRKTYDPESDCGYVYFRDIEHGGSHRTIEVKIAPEGIFGSLVVDVDAEGRVCGIEVLGASTVMPKGFFGA